jgi:hypothetical protein
VSAGNFQRGNAAPFCCPLTARQMNGKFRFVALRPSGLVCAAEAIKGGLRAAVDDMIGGQLNAQTVVPINGTEEEEDALWAHLMERRQAAAAASGKKKKRGNPPPPPHFLPPSPSPYSQVGVCVGGLPSVTLAIYTRFAHMGAPHGTRG